MVMWTRKNGDGLDKYPYYLIMAFYPIAERSEWSS